MAVPTHFRFQVRGNFIGTPETWQTGCHFSRDNTVGLDANYGDISESGVTTAVTAFFGSSRFGPAVGLVDWRMYEIGEDGKMATPSGPLLHTFPPNTYRGTGSADRYPPQVSLVATLVAPNRGPAHFGRMYFPSPNTTLQSDLRISATDAATWATDIGAFLKAVSDQIDLEGTQSSEGLNISPGPPGSTTGSRQTIDHIEVGRVLDTLRNRRKSLLEARAVGGHLDW